MSLSALVLVLPSASQRPSPLTDSIDHSASFLKTSCRS
jgi:hypothetical protein